MFRRELLCSIFSLPLLGLLKKNDKCKIHERCKWIEKDDGKHCIIPVEHLNVETILTALNWLQCPEYESCRNEQCSGILSFYHFNNKNYKKVDLSIVGSLLVQHWIS